MWKMIFALINIAILGFCALLFDVDINTMLLFSIAFDLIYLRMNKDEEKEK
jgi:uncharacterized membrane protein